MEPGIAKEIVQGDKSDIRASDILLVNAPKPSWGTAMEIVYGYQAAKRVVVVMPEGTTPSPWLLYHADMILYGSVTEAVRSLMPALSLVRI